MISNINISTNRKNQIGAFREVEELLNNKNIKDFLELTAKIKHYPQTLTVLFI